MDSLSSSSSWVKSMQDDLGSYSNVVFTGVDKLHSALEDLKCTFEYRKCLIPSSDDYVGLIHVGYSSLDELVTSQKIVPTDTEPKAIVFSAKDLPKERNNYYQFVYVKNNVVQGASIAFLLQVPHEELLSDDEDYLIIGPSDKSASISMELYGKCLSKMSRIEEEKNALAQKLHEYEESALAKPQDCEEASGRASFNLDSIKAELSQENKSIPGVCREAAALEEKYMRCENALNEKEVELAFICEKLREEIESVEAKSKELLELKEKCVEYNDVISCKEELASMQKEVDDGKQSLAKSCKELRLFKDKCVKLEIKLAQKSAELKKALKSEEAALNLKSRLESQVDTLTTRNIELQRVVNKELNVDDLLDQLAQYEDLVEALQASKEALNTELKKFKQ